MRMQLLLVVLLAFCRYTPAVGGKVDKRQSHYCSVRDDQFSYDFDFRKLTDENEDYVIKHHNDVLRLQLCKPLKENCNNAPGYSICLSKGGQQIGLGKEPPEVLQEFGKIIFKYTGDKCNDNYAYTVSIKMICDFAVKDGSGIQFAAAVLETNECQYNIVWRTDAACAPREQINCTLDDKSGHYDLTKLINYSDNYEFFISDGSAIILNVCHSVLYGPEACSTSNGACLVEYQSSTGEDLKIKSKGLGGLKQNLTIDSDGHLSLTYKDGSICDKNGPNTPGHMETTITFICDLDAVGTLPIYQGGKEMCRYKLSWKTASACSEEALHKKSLEKTNNNICVVKDPITNHVYNLTALMNKEFTVRLFATTEVYKFSICSPLANTTCKAGSGACRLHNSISGGIANYRLMWKESGPYLNYTNGNLCYKNQRQRYTIIEFYCSDEEDYEIDEENDLCYEVIKMSTNLVCAKKKTECASFRNEVNLKSLTLPNKNYISKHNDAEFYINICRPLVKEENLNCTNGEAACKKVISNGKVIKTINLGYPGDSPIVTGGRSSILYFRNGSICEEDKKRKIQTKISFLCDPYLSTSSQGIPEFTMYENCTYCFDWRTNIVCGKVDGLYNENNNIVTNELGDHQNLSVLVMDGNSVYHVQNKKKDKMYKISLSSNKKSCNGAFICDNELNYGTKTRVQWDYNNNLIRLSFTDGSKCSDGSLAQSTFTIICNEKSFSDQPVFLREDTCSVEFEWYTNKICKSYNVQQMSTITAANGGEIIIIIILIIIVLLICYLFDSSRRSRFLDLFMNSNTRSCDRVKYSRVNTVEEVHLLLNTSDPTVIESDSDDDLLEA